MFETVTMDQNSMALVKNINDLEALLKFNTEFDKTFNLTSSLFMSGGLCYKLTQSLLERYLINTKLSISNDVRGAGFEDGFAFCGIKEFFSELQNAWCITLDKSGDFISSELEISPQMRNKDCDATMFLDYENNSRFFKNSTIKFLENENTFFQDCLKTLNEAVSELEKVNDRCKKESEILQLHYMDLKFYGKSVSQKIEASGLGKHKYLEILESGIISLSTILFSILPDQILNSSIIAECTTFNEGVLKTEQSFDDYTVEYQTALDMHKKNEKYYNFMNFLLKKYKKLFKSNLDCKLTNDASRIVAADIKDFDGKNLLDIFSQNGWTLDGNKNVAEAEAIINFAENSINCTYATTNHFKSNLFQLEVSLVFIIEKGLYILQNINDEFFDIGNVLRNHYLNPENFEKKIDEIIKESKLSRKDYYKKLSIGISNLSMIIFGETGQRIAF